MVVAEVPLAVVIRTTGASPGTALALVGEISLGALVVCIRYSQPITSL